MKTMSAVAILFLAGHSFAGEPQKYRKHLDQATEIQGYRCAKGYAWFHSDGRLDSCTLDAQTAFGDALAPAGSWIRLTADGKPLYLGLARNTRILDFVCQGGGALGPQEGFTTVFYPSGWLKLCWLAGDQDVQGVPCRGAGGFFTAVTHGGRNPSAQFNEDGTLERCTLSKDFGGAKSGQEFVKAR